MGSRLITLQGEMDIEYLAELKAALAECGTETSIDVDMSEVTFIDSSILGCLIGAYKTLDRGGHRLRIVRPSPRVVHLLKLTGQLERFTDGSS